MEAPKPGFEITRREVTSLLAEMQDGNEYGSIVSLVPKNLDVGQALREAITDIETIRQRPCLCYVGNLIRPKLLNTSIDPSDHLPFNEMVGKVADGVRAVDLFLATPGGSAEQVNLFVEALRGRFDDVQFLIPYKAMSAGTLWALSGDAIWMDSRSFLGPIDPQVPASDGQFVPAQALLVLLNQIQVQGQAKLNQKLQPDWTLVQLLRWMDQRQLGAALTATEYASSMAATYLQKYKFRGWTSRRSTGAPVDAAMRQARAKEVAGLLSDHTRWKAHGHAISRQVAEDEVRIRIDRFEAVQGLQRAIRRAWALWYYMLDRTPVAKAILSQDYAFFRMAQEGKNNG